MFLFANHQSVNVSMIKTIMMTRIFIGLILTFDTHLRQF